MEDHQEATSPRTAAKRAPRRPTQRTTRSVAGYGPSPVDAARERSGVARLADVVALVPHRMGFHPRRSLVAILLDADGEWMATARHDWHPGVPAHALRDWLEDIGEEAHGLIVGLYGEEDAARGFLPELGESVPLVITCYLVPEPAEPGHVVPEHWYSNAGPGWEQHDGAEIFASAAALEEWGAGSVPGTGPAAHALAEPGLRELAAWQAGEREAAAELLALRAWLIANGLEEAVEEPWVHGVGESGGRRAPEAGPGDAAGRPAPGRCGADDPFTEGEWAEMGAVARRGLCAWGVVLDRQEAGEHWMDWEEWERAELVLALHSLVAPGVRDILLLLTACGGADVEPSEVLLGLWQGPVDGVGLLALEEALESAGGLGSPRLRVEALCLLAWIEWARGHGSVAGATLELAERTWAGHRLTALLRSFIDTGSVPRWLRPSHGGRGARWGG
ncbi:MAG: DUF4192 domain-containing protein [Arthrobacter sp.]|nr:DUF4192 domain-containing protein [Arthrobacter sp.]